MPRATTSDGVDIAYDVEGNGPPLVLVHGITEDRLLWQPVVDLLKPDFRCISIDLRGHGESGTAADYGALSMAQDLAAVVAAQGPAEAPAVVGHSLGGVVVTVYAVMSPVRAVVNVDQPLRLGEMAAALRAMEPALRGDGFAEAMLALWESLGEGVLPDATREAVRRRHGSARPEVVLGVWDAVFSSTDEELDAIFEQQVLPNVRAPYLALHGSDPGADYEAWLTALVPTAEVEVWDGELHWLHLRDPARFAERVRAFVNRAGSPAPG